MRKILQNAGFAGILEGFNPYTGNDELLDRKTANMSLLKIHPVGIGNGAYDPGGLFSVWSLVSIFLIILIVLMMLK